MVGVGLFDRGRGLISDRQHDGERRPGARFRLDRDGAVVLGDDAVDGGQAEPGAAVAFGGEERFEDMGDDLGGHSRAGVADPQPQLAAGCGW